MLLAQMEASGVDTTIGITSLKKAVTNLTDSGKPLNTALSEVISSIKNAKSDTEALNIASSTFGSKGAAEMSKAIRDGRLDINDLAASLQSYGSVVSETFEETQDPWDEATIATNNLKLAGADAHEGQPVPVGLVHIGLDLEDEGGEVLGEHVHLAGVRHPGQGRRGHAEELLQERLHAEGGEGGAEEHGGQGCLLYTSDAADD